MAKRAGVALAALGATFAAYWLLLPAVRAWLLPAPEPGGWVLGPPLALRFGACTILSALTLPLLMLPLGRRWRLQDLQETGAPRDPFAKRPGARRGLLLKGGLLFVIYAICGAFYFRSHTVIGAQRITIQSPLGTRSYGYDQIVALERVAPRGGQPVKYAIRFEDDSWGYFGAANEGCDARAALAIAAHVATRSGHAWALVDR